MHVIAKRSFLFLERPAPIDPDKPVPPAGRRHTLSATPSPQEVPDWLIDDGAFKNCVAAGEIQLLSMVTRGEPATEEKPARRKAK
jgi:hypothetical protein